MSKYKIIALLIIVTSSQVLLAQDEPVVDVSFLSELPTYEDVNYPKKLEQYSTYKLLGSTKEYIVIQETVVIGLKSSYKYWIDHAVVMHFFDINNPNTKVFSSEIWKQTRAEFAGKASKGPNKLYEDEPPVYKVVSERIVGMTDKYTKYHSTEKGKAAALLCSYKIVNKNLQKKIIKVHSSIFRYVEAGFGQSLDGSSIVIESNGLLTKSEKKNAKACTNIYDLDLNLIHHIPMESSGLRNFYFKDKIVQFSISEKDKTDVYYLSCDIFDLKQGETSSIDLLEIGHQDNIFIGSIQYVQLLEYSEQNPRFVFISKNRDKKMKSQIVRLDLSNSINVQGDVEDCDLTYGVESDEGYQEKYQYEYFQALETFDILDEEVSPESHRYVQNGNSFVTSTVQLTKLIKNQRYYVGYPLILTLEYNNSYQTLVLNRIMNKYGFGSQIPYVVSTNNGFVTLLANFSSPYEMGKNQTTYDYSPQILQALVVDLDESTTTRYNVIDRPDAGSNVPNIFPKDNSIINVNGNLFFLAKKVKDGPTYVVRLKISEQ